jgi:Tol biopolymer transport system component
MRGNVKKVDAAGGQPVTLADVSFSAGAAWNADGVILFTPAGNGPLYRVSATGGTATPVTSLDASRGEVQHSFPSFLPDGKHFLFSTLGNQAGGVSGGRAILLGALDSTDPPRLLVDRGTLARYADGHLVFLRDGSLMAQPFDLTTLETRGAAETLVERALTSGSFAVSATGVLAYQIAASTPSQLSWFNRAGERIGTLGEPADQVDVVISPDGARAATSVLDPSIGTRDIWVFDLARGLRDRVTSNRADEFAPVWAPSGGRLAFSAVRNGGVDIYEQAPDGAERRLASGPAGLGKFAASWSPDGSQILYIGGGRIISRSDLMLLPLGADRTPKPFVDSEFLETQGRFSPDGRWVAYAANDSGRLEVYVRPFPGPGTPTRVSDSGGRWPRWRRDGSELFYLTGDGTLVAVAVDGKAPQFQVGGARPLFRTRFRPMDRLDAYSYDVSPDGQRFLVNGFIEDITVSAPITLLTNWPALVKQ